MFGHNDDQSNDKKDAPKDTLGVMPPVVPDPSVTAGLSGSPVSSSDTPSAPSVPSASSAVEPNQDAGILNVSNSSADSTASSSLAEKPSSSTVSNNDDTPSMSDDSTDEPEPEDSELMDVKRQALQQLSPLVGQLDQTPEEKFRTTMMMIQASDDSKLVKAAYEAAQGISDDKSRAQALLDVINEINYFTQHKS